jgi:hypothetical protein
MRDRRGRVVTVACALHDFAGFSHGGAGTCAASPLGMKASTLIMGSSIVLAALTMGCGDDTVEGTGGSSVDQGEPSRSGSSVAPAGSACSLHRPLFDAPVEGAEACGGASEARVSRDDDPLYLVRHLRSHVAQTSSFVGLGSILLHDVLLDAMAGRALETIGLGSWDRGVDYAFDATTGEYTITAKSGLVVGNEKLGDWDVKNAKGEIRFRLYWGTGALAGQPLMADVFDASSYLVEPKLSVDVFAARVTVSYQSAGPLVGLLGWGEAPRSPAVVRLSDADRIRANVASILADAHVVVRIGQPECAYTSLDFATTQKSLGDWVTAPDLSLDFVAGGSERAYPTAEKITITDWNAKLASQGDWLEGPVNVSSSSRRAMTAEMILRRGDVTPEMRVSCR